MNAQQRLVEQAEARKDLADARQNLLGVRSLLWMYNDSEGTEFSAAKGDAMYAEAKDKLRAAIARDKVAYQMYTDPFKRKPENQEESE